MRQPACVMILSEKNACRIARQADSASDHTYKYGLAEVHPVSGRLGVCAVAGYYWVSGSGTLAKPKAFP